jgi:N-acetylornithine carbamoyltransferase
VAKRDLLALDDWQPADIDRLLALAARVKRGEAGGGLEGKVLGVLSAGSDMRTRASIETAMYLQGGHSTALNSGTEAGASENGESEHLLDTARLLARWTNAVAVGVQPAESDWGAAREDGMLKHIAAACDKPVINLGSARRNPCQALADSLTLEARLGRPEGKRFVLAWSWNPKALSPAIPTSAALAAARLGMEIVIARPQGYELDPEDTALIRRTAQQAGGEAVHISDDADDALVGADVVYLASWGSLKLYGHLEQESQIRSQHRDWGLTHLRHRGTRAGKGIVMHAPPVWRNVAIEDRVLDGPYSAVLDQGENLLYAHRAVLLDLLSPAAE